MKASLIYLLYLVDWQYGPEECSHFAFKGIKNPSITDLPLRTSSFPGQARTADSGMIWPQEKPLREGNLVIIAHNNVPVSQSVSPNHVHLVGV